MAAVCVSEHHSCDLRSGTLLSACLVCCVLARTSVNRTTLSRVSHLGFRSDQHQYAVNFLKFMYSSYRNTRFTILICHHTFRVPPVSRWSTACIPKPLDALLRFLNAVFVVRQASLVPTLYASSRSVHQLRQGSICDSSLGLGLGCCSCLIFLDVSYRRFPVLS